MLQVCHSQGAIHVKNALERAPPEIRDRLIVVAIAPGAVVPKELCFQSYNYASERDIVYKFEPQPIQFLEPGAIDDVIILRYEYLKGHEDELILLQPHPGATGIDHSFDSPTYENALLDILKDYKQHNGEFLPEEKGKLK